MNMINLKETIDGVSGEIIYAYDDFIRDILFRFKGCDDIELKDVFFERRALLFHLKYKDYTLINVPSNKSEDERRGYNHVVKMFEQLKLPILSVVHKKIEFKQSDLTSKQRKDIINKLQIDNVDLRNKKILIIDDVTTTGNTLKAMISLIKDKKPRDIKFLIMSKHLQ